jgi:subtilase family serine protease
MPAPSILRKLGLFSVVIFVVVLSLLVLTPCVYAQIDAGAYKRARILQGINETERVVLAGNTHPEARAANDRGRVPNGFAMDHMLLQLKRSPEQELALQQFVEALQIKGSPNYHHWISAQEFGERFGLAKSDLEAVSGWLESHGFHINVVYPSGMLIDFSGNAGEVRKAFQTEIHYLEVKGETHVGNMSDPQIPAALFPVVAGVVSLHDFRPHAMYHLRKANKQFTTTDLFGDLTYAVVPADLAKIYNLNPLFSAGISGQGQTIVLIEDTDVYKSSDWNTFRQTFGLDGYSSSFTQVHPPAPPSQPGNNCAAPGVIAPNDAEAILDAEWASAAAPSAAIEMAACADTSNTFGGLIAIENLINANTAPPSIMSISYGQCETVNGAAANAAYDAAYQQAVAEGVSVFVAAGDSGAAGCDNSAAEATHGIGVNAFASTPNNVAVGGTDFSDTYSGTNTTYWNSSNTSAFGSAVSYVPEIPWNDSCASALVSGYEGYSPTYGSTSLCNDPIIGFLLMSTVAGGGGPSQCASGAPTTAGVVSGTCAGWAKPAWQSVLGNPSDGVRDTPDVSLFAADGLWSHFYVFCWSDSANGGAACGADPSAWSGAGGTSFASPIMAGIQALINQKAGGPQGNPAPIYYQLAAAEYGSSGSSSCNSDNGNAVGSGCIFYDVTSGDMDVDCVGSNCYLADGTVGVLSTSNTSFAPAYGTNVGWDFATGIGTVNAANLVNNWPTSAPQPSFTLSASPASLTFLQGGSGLTTITINPVNGFSGNVNWTASGLPSGVTATFGTNPATSTSQVTFSATSSAATGVFNVSVIGTSGTLSGKVTITVTVNPAGDYTLSASPSSLSVVQGAKGTSTITVNPLSGFDGSVSLSATGLPSAVTAGFNPSSTTGASTLTLTASSTAALGTFSITITGNSGGLSHSTSVSLTVAAPPNFAISASPNSLSLARGGKVTSTISITPQNGFTGAVSLSAARLPRGVTASFNPSSTTGVSTLTLSATSKAATGGFTIRINGTSGSLTHTATISLTVQR